MGVVDGFSGASVQTKVALIVIIVAVFCNWIAFCTTSWGVTELSNNDRHVGLWRICDTATPGCTILDGYAKVWYGVVQAFSILGFMGLNVACVLIVLYVFWGSCKNNGEAGMAAGVTCIISAVCWLLAVIIFGAKYEDDSEVSSSGDKSLGFSFGLAIVALILEVIAGILMILQSKKS